MGSALTSGLPHPNPAGEVLRLLLFFFHCGTVFITVFIADYYGFYKTEKFAVCAEKPAEIRRVKIPVVSILEHPTRTQTGRSRWALHRLQVRNTFLLQTPPTPYLWENLPTLGVAATNKTKEQHHPPLFRPTSLTPTNHGAASLSLLLSVAFRHYGPLAVSFFTGKIPQFLP